MKKNIITTLTLFSFILSNAQNVGIGTTTPVARLHVSDSNVLFTGPSILPAMPGNPPVNGAGNRVMWYADKAAFRAGGVEFNNWDKENIGNFSFASGLNTYATGLYATSMGYNTRAGATGATSLGSNTTSSGFISTSMGSQNTSSGFISTSMGSQTTASGEVSTSMGSQTWASGDYSISMGKSTTSSGPNSTSIGLSTTASGSTSLSTGIGSAARGSASASMGYYTIAKSDNSLSIGKFNDTSATNRLFEIGNGTANNARTNALTVIDNGNVGIGNSEPGFILDLSKRIRLRSENASLGAGIWFNSNDNSTLNTFLGNDVSNNLQVYSLSGSRTIAHFNPTTGGFRVEGPVAAATGSAIASFGGNGDFVIDKPGVIGGRFTVKENGNVGIGNATPNVPLSFASLLGKKITLYPGATGDVGFGVAGNRLQIYSDNPNADVAIGYDAAGIFNERFTVKPNGALALQGNSGLPGQVLSSNGSGNAASWVKPVQFDGNTATIPTLFNITSTNYLIVLGTTRTITIPAGQSATLCYSALIDYFPKGCTGFGCFADGAASIFLDNVDILGTNSLYLNLDNSNFGMNLSIPNITVPVSAGTHVIDVRIKKDYADVVDFAVRYKFSTLMALPN